MRGAQRKNQQVLLRQLLRAVTADTFASGKSAASSAYFSPFSTTTNTPSRSSFSSRSFWSWCGPGSFEYGGLTTPQEFLWDGSFKISRGSWGSSSSLRHTRGAKINGSEIRKEYHQLTHKEKRELCESILLYRKVKTGFIIMRKGRITQVLKTQHTQQGRGGATIQVELRDVQSGLKSSERLRTGEAIEKVFVDDRIYSFLYLEGDTVYLMEPNTFEQLDIPKSFFGAAAAYLTDGMEVKVQYFDGKPLSAVVPDRVTCTVVEAEPYFKGQTATPQYKKVVLDNGVQIMTPSFVVAGDRVVVDTAENLYMTRAKE